MTAAMNEAGIAIRMASRHVRRLHCFTEGRIRLPSMNRWMSSSSGTIINTTKLSPPTTKGRTKTTLTFDRQWHLGLARNFGGVERYFGSKGEGEEKGVAVVTSLTENVKQQLSSNAPGWFATRFMKEHDPYKRELEWTFHAWHVGLLGIHLLIVWWFIHKNYESHLKDFYNPLGSDGSKSLSMARLKYLEQQRRKLKAFTSVEDDLEASPKEMQRRKMEAFKLVEKEEHDRMAKQHTDEVKAMTGTKAVSPNEKLAATMKWREDVAAKLKENAVVRKATIAVAAATTTTEEKETVAPPTLIEDAVRNGSKKAEEVMVLADNNNNSRCRSHQSDGGGVVVEQKDAEGKEISSKAQEKCTGTSTISTSSSVMKGNSDEEEVGGGPPVLDLIVLQKKIESLEAKFDSAMAKHEISDP